MARPVEPVGDRLKGIAEFSWKLYEKEYDEETKGRHQLDVKYDKGRLRTINRLVTD